MSCYISKCTLLTQTDVDVSKHENKYTFVSPNKGQNKKLRNNINIAVLHITFSMANNCTIQHCTSSSEIF